MSEVKTNKISSLASNNDITLDPDGTGDVVVASGNCGIGTSSPSNFGGTTLQTNHASTFSANLVSSGAYILQMIASETHGTMSVGARSNHHVAFTTNDTERMRIDTSGNVGIGKSSSITDKLHIENTGANCLLSVARTDGAAGRLVMQHTSSVGALQTTGSVPLTFGTVDTERMRLSETGRLEFQTVTNETSQGLQSQRIDWRNENNAGIMAGIGVVRTADANAPGAFVIRTSTDVDSASNNSDGEISEKFRVAPNGDLTATDTSIASNSDQRLKENIADYAYDLAKFKQFQTRTFNWKQPTLHGEKSGVRGFVAQELEAIDSYWVNEIEVQPDSDDYQYLPDTDIPYGPNNIYKPDDAAETDTQRVARFAKTSKLGQKDAMYVSVIQQLIAKIETLEARVAALEGA